jgi:hypothetical protein
MKRKRAEKPKMEGDVLGISDSPPEAELPRATSDRGGHPEGIELGERRRHTGADELRPSKGATGIDMGAGGEDTGLESTASESSERRKI